MPALQLVLCCCSSSVSHSESETRRVCSATEISHSTVQSPGYTVAPFRVCQAKSGKGVPISKWVSLGGSALHSLARWPLNYRAHGRGLC